MNTINSILFLSFSIICSFKGNDPDREPTHSNAYYSIFPGYNQSMNDVDSVIVVDQHGKRSSYPLKSGGIGEYPSLYKDRLISIIYGKTQADVITFSPSNNKIDTICSDLQVLQTSSIDEYDGIAVIRDYNKYAILDIEKKQILKVSDCFLENILLTESGYFLIRTLNNISEPKPYLCKGSITGAEDTKLIDLPGMGVQNYQDGTTLGWNGMTIYHGILFIHMMDQILAYDIQQNKIIDKIMEERPVFCDLNKSNPTFCFEKEKIVFNMKKKQFKRN